MLKSRGFLAWPRWKWRSAKKPRWRSDRSVS